MLAMAGRRARIEEDACGIARNHSDQNESYDADPEKDRQKL